GVQDIYLVSFLESMDEESKKKYQAVYHDPGTKVRVHPVFIEIGRP
ncbi:MAG: hypothetical protein GY940_27950, partial [bacterium]|nr:hypothetical protein [bacterium]